MLQVKENRADQINLKLLVLIFYLKFELEPR